ncbi:MAG: hypothetical protein GEV08_05675 [Acidimicrobiia bacterium]|nr:hypothetical protein [Acidimicrobiia bacterium]
MKPRRRLSRLVRRAPVPTPEAVATVPGATAVGVLDGSAAVEVGPDGTVRTPALTLRAWIGADDRWHRLDHEVAVRQRLAGDAPVVETLLRVPGGDVIWRAYGVRPAGGGEALVVELENGSRLPVALALVVEPRPLAALRVEGPALWLAEGGHARAGRAGGDSPPDAALLVGAREPGMVARGDDLDDLFEGLAGDEAAGDEAAGDAGDVPSGVAGPGAATRFVALVHPVTHGTTSSFVLPLDGPPPAAGALGGLPRPDAVARGWRQMLGSASLVDLPEPSWEAALAAVRAQLVLGATAAARVPRGQPGAGAPAAEAGGPALGAAARALDAWGHHEEAGRLLAALTAELATSFDTDLCAAFLVALEQHWHLGGDEGLAAAAVEDVAHAVAVVDRARRRQRPGSNGDRLAVPLDGAARLLDAGGQSEAAAEVRGRLAASSASPGGARPSLEASSDAVDELLRAASPTWTWPEPWLGARVLLGIRSALVGGAPDGPLEVLPGWRPQWLGQGLEVHGLPVPGGRLSYAVRWHGERPALLWEVVTADGDDVTVSLRVPVLAPAWRGEGARGEALLEAPGPGQPPGAGQPPGTGQPPGAGQPPGTGRPPPDEAPGAAEFS